MPAILRRLEKVPAKKLALSVVLIGAAAALAGPGAFATFTSSVNGGPQSITTGTVIIALGATGASTNRLNINATGVAPGDTIQRSVDLSNTGSLNLASITLGVSASPSSALDTDGANGLQTTVQSCSVAWTEAGPPYTYTCSGTSASVLASTSVLGLKTTPASLSPLASLTAGQTDHLLVTLTLPTTADNTFQNLTSTLTYAFTGTQRAAQSD
ncbi:MAG TPA: TasA family protein [Acidimicrobiales bacterium]|nr:TasA family protein [Acidimicrobiales bacterium]